MRRVAIVGSGISGLVAAHLLHPDHAVTVFEAGAYVGGHTNTVDVGGTPVDTGFIVYNERTYPNFTRLLAQLGVPTQPSSMTFSVRCERTGIEWNGTNLNTLFAQRRNLLRPRFLRMVRDILRFNREAPRALDNGVAALPLGEFVARGGYSRPFVEHYLLPMGSAIWSMPERRLLAFPTGFFVRFFHNHGMLSVDDRPEWRVVQGGSREYVKKLVAPFRDRIRLNTPVHSVRRFDDRVEVHAGLARRSGAGAEAGDAFGTFDEVVLACHSDQALRLLAEPTEAEREILGALPYQGNRAVLHTDTRLLPRTRRAWAAWNYHARGERDAPVGVTYNMNILQSLRTDATYCVSLNRDEAVAAESVVRSIDYEHPVYSTGGVRAQARHGEINGSNRTRFCGAYWGYGFHEDGVVSALRATGRTL